MAEKSRERLILEAKAKAKSQRDSLETQPQQQSTDRSNMNFTPDFNEAELRSKVHPSLAYGDEAFAPRSGIIEGVKSGLTSGIDQPSPQAVAETPGQVLTGEALGGMAQAAVLPAKRIYDVGSGALQGFTSTQGTIPQKLGGALLGGSLGLVFGGAGQTVGKIVKGTQKIVPKIEEQALGLKSGDLFSIAKKGKKIVEDSVEGITKTLREAGIFRRGGTPVAIEASKQEIKEQAIKMLDDSFRVLDDSGFKISSSELVEQIDEHLKDLNNFPSAFSEEIGKLNKFRADLLQNPEIHPSKIRELTQIVADQTFNNASEVVNKEAFVIWKNLKDAVDNVAEKVGGPVGEQIKQANKVYSAVTVAEKAIARNVSKERGQSLAKFISHPIESTSKAVEQGVINKVIGNREWVQENSKKLGKFAPVLEKALSRGGQSAAVNFYRLSQTSPEFREKIKEIEEKDNGAK